MKKETYEQMLRRHEEEYFNFSKGCVFFAYSESQFNDGMKSIGLNANETDKIYRFGEYSYILRSKSKEQLELFDKFLKEKEKAVADDKDGTGFIVSMFEYELENQEFLCTGDIASILCALDLTIADIKADERLLNGFKIALRKLAKKVLNERRGSL